MQLNELPGVTLQPDGAVLISGAVSLEEAIAARLDASGQVSDARILAALARRHETLAAGGFFAPEIIRPRSIIPEDGKPMVRGELAEQPSAVVPEDRAALQGETIRAIDLPEHIPATAGESLRASVPAIPTPKPNSAVKHTSEEKIGVAVAKEIRARIREAAKAKGVSLQALGKALSLHPTYFSASQAWGIPMARVHQAALALAVSPHWLYTGEGAMGNAPSPVVAEGVPMCEEPKARGVVPQVSPRLAAIQRLGDAAVALISAEVDFTAALVEVNRLCKP